MNDYQVSFSSQLKVNPKDLVTIWNETQECRAVAKAELKSEKFDPGSAFVILGGIAAGVATGMIYDLIKLAAKKLFEKLGFSEERINSVEVQVIDNPDGSRIVVIVIKEK